MTFYLQRTSDPMLDDMLVEISSLDELKGFIKENGKVVIRERYIAHGERTNEHGLVVPVWEATGDLVLEVYDDYRE